MLEAPFKVRNHIERFLFLPWIRFAFFLGGVTYGRRFRIFGAPIFQRTRGSVIHLGDGLELRSWSRSNPLTPRSRCVFATRRPDATIRVGIDCGFTGSVLVSATSIEIGNRVFLGSNTTIIDTDFHALSPAARARGEDGESLPVRIEDDVFVGTQALILKGVTVGRGAVIGAGAVVTKNVPPFSIVAGNPAQVVGKVPGGDPNE